MEKLAKLFEATVFIAIGALFGGVAGSCTWMRAKDRYWQAEAASRGAAEFVIIDTLTGATEFRWRVGKAGGR